MMKRWKKIVIGILMVPLIMIIGLAVWQKDNLKAVYTFLTNDSESISQDMEDKQEALEKDYNITIQAPTANQNNDLLDGKITPEEVKEALGLTQGTESLTEQEKTEPESVEKPVQDEPPKQETPPAQEVAPEEPKQPTEEEKKAQIEALVNQCAAELYICEVDLMAQMGEMKKIALQDWNSRTPEGRTKEKMIKFGFSWLDEVYKVEVVADRKVKDILDRYREPLNELDADTSVLDDMWMYYCDKKTSTKAYYLNKYLD